MAVVSRRGAVRTGVRRWRPGGVRSPVGALRAAAGIGVLPFVAILPFSSRLDVVLPQPDVLAFDNVAEILSAKVTFSVFGVGWFTHDQSETVVHCSWPVRSSPSVGWSWRTC